MWKRIGRWFRRRPRGCPVDLGKMTICGTIISTDVLVRLKATGTLSDCVILSRQQYMDYQTRETVAAILQGVASQPLRN